MFGGCGEYLRDVFGGGACGCESGIDPGGTRPSGAFEGGSRLSIPAEAEAIAFCAEAEAIAFEGIGRLTGGARKAP